MYFKRKKMKEFDESLASPEELWDYCMLEYQNRNPIVKILLDRFYKSIFEIMPSLQIGDKVLEVGCGAGESTRRIIEMMKDGVHYEASEFDPRYVEILSRTEFPVKVCQESVYELKRGEGAFQLIIMLEVLEHLQNYEKALSELFRVSGKYVMISVPNEPLWRILNMIRGKYILSLGNTPGHINHWTPSRLTRLLSKYGRIVRINTPLPWIIVLVEKK